MHVKTPVHKSCQQQNNLLVFPVFKNMKNLGRIRELNSCPWSPKLLADRTNSRAYATMLRPSSSVCRRLRRYVLWLNGAS